MKIWFQNRRNKWKRQIAADNEASNLRSFSGIPLFLQSTAAAANLHAAAVANGSCSIVYFFMFLPQVYLNIHTSHLYRVSKYVKLYAFVLMLLCDEANANFHCSL